jgi:hypothetical protein
MKNILQQTIATAVRQQKVYFSLLDSRNTETDWLHALQYDPVCKTSTQARTSHTLIAFVTLFMLKLNTSFRQAVYQLYQQGI